MLRWLARVPALFLPPSAPLPCCTRPAAVRNRQQAGLAVCESGCSWRSFSWCSPGRVVGSGYSCVDPLPLGLQRLVHGRRHERGDIPAQARDLAHQRGRNEAVLLGGRQEQRLDFGNQVPVHAGKLEFVLEVRHRAQPAQQDSTTDFRDEMRQQRVEAANLDRSEEHTSELQSLMRISYAVFCLKKKQNTIN